MKKEFEPKEFLEKFIRIRDAVRRHFGAQEIYRYEADHPQIYRFISNNVFVNSHERNALRNLYAENLGGKILTNSDAITFLEVYYRDYYLDGLVEFTRMHGQFRLDALQLADLKNFIIEKMKEPEHKIEEVTMQQALPQNRKQAAFFPM